MSSVTLFIPAAPCPSSDLPTTVMKHVNLRNLVQVPYRIYFGREVACTDRSIIYKYGLPHRKYLGPTSMDTEMAFIMCNQGQVCTNSIIADVQSKFGVLARHDGRSRLCHSFVLFVQLYSSTPIMSLLMCTAFLPWHRHVQYA